MTMNDRLGVDEASLVEPNVGSHGALLAPRVQTQRMKHRTARCCRWEPIRSRMEGRFQLSTLKKTRKSLVGRWFSGLSRSSAVPQL